MNQLPRFLLISLFFLAQAFAIEVITVQGPSEPTPEIQQLDLKDSFFFTPAVNLSPSSELEHLTGLRSPVLNAGAGAGSIGVYLENVSFRAQGYGNTNQLLGAPYELLFSEIYPGPSSERGNIIHGHIQYRSLKSQRKGTRARLSSDTQSRYRLILDHQSPQTLVAGVYDRSTGWREGSAFTQAKGHFHQFYNLGQVEGSTQLYLYSIDQNTSGYLIGKDSYRDRARLRQSDLEGAYRQAQGLLVRQNFLFDEHQLTLFARSHQMDFNMHWFPTAPTEDNSHTSYGAVYGYSRELTSTLTTSLETTYDFTRGRLEETQTQPSIGPFLQGEHYDYSIKSHYLSGVLSLHWRPLDRLLVQPGVRLNFHQHQYQNNLSNGILGRYKRVPSRTDRYRFAQPYLHLETLLGPWGKLKLKLDRSARSPEVNDLYRQLANQKDEEIPFERISSAELRYELTRDQYRGGLSLYTMRKRDFYFRDANADNILGKTQHQGLEFDFHFSPRPVLELGVYGTHALHRYVFDLEPTITYGQVIESAPRSSYSGHITLRPLDRFRLGLHGQYLSSYFIDTSNQHSYSGYTLFHLQGSLSIKRSTLSLSIRNLFDTRYAERADYFQGQYRYFPGRPRVVFLGLEHLF